MKKLFPFVLLLVLVLTACCHSGPPKMYLIIKDASGDNIISSNTITDDQHFSFLDAPSDMSGEPTSIGQANSHNALEFNSWQVNSGQDVYLRIDTADVDTINLIFNTIDKRCTDQIEISQATYNGNLFVAAGGNTVVVTKQ